MFTKISYILRFIFVLLPVQVNIVSISSDGRPSTVFRGPCISIRVHSGHKVDLGIRDQNITTGGTSVLFSKRVTLSSTP